MKIEVENLTLRYPILAMGNGTMSGMPKMSNGDGGRYVEALKDVSFSVGPGVRLGVLGRNGSGKSTLLRVLGGIFEPSEGRVTVEGKVSSLFNLNLGIRPDYTGYQNIFLRGIIKGLKRRDILAKVDEIVEFSEIGEFINLPMRTYSAGMSMRLIFAIATAFDPEVLLLDEWIGAGDQQFQKKASMRMNELVVKSGITVLASHNRSLIRNVCDTAIWLDRGVLQAHGPVDEVYKMMDASP